MVWIGGRWWAVIGILDPVPLLSSLDSAVMVGFDAAARPARSRRQGSSIYVRMAPKSVESVRAVLAATTNPSAPNEVSVERPSDALKARAAVDNGLRALLLALGGVSLLVGGIGIANVMVISVLERRTEIGVRRAIGATRRHIRLQFLTEAATLSMLGGIGGVALGCAVTAVYARRQDVPLTIPPTVLFGGVAAALIVGAIAGLYPATRAARLDPAEALRPPRTVSQYIAPDLASAGRAPRAMARSAVSDALHRQHVAGDGDHPEALLEASLDQRRGGVDARHDAGVLAAGDDRRQALVELVGLPSLLPGGRPSVIDRSAGPT